MRSKQENLNVAGSVEVIAPVRNWRFFALVICLNICGCSREKAEEKLAMNIPTQLVAHCVGRYVIELPASAEFLGSNDEYGAMDIEINEMQTDDYTKEIDGFERSLRDTKHRRDASLLLKMVGKNTGAPVFAHWKHDFSTSAIEVTGYRWIEGVRYLFKTVADPKRVDEATTYVGETIRRLQGRGNKVPTASGFCIRGGLILDNNDSSGEQTSVSFRLRDFPDIIIEVSTSRNDGTLPDTLLSRKPGIFSALEALGLSAGGLYTIHDGSRAIAGIPGQEWLARAPNDYKFQSHIFTWEAQGKPNSTLFPQIRIELRTASYGGGVDPGPSSLTDEQARRLWDQIVSTLHLRATSIDTHSNNQ